MILLLVSYRLGACFNPEEFFSQYIPDLSQWLISYFLENPFGLLCMLRYQRELKAISIVFLL